MSETKKAIYKRWWFWVGAFFVLIIVAAASSPSDTKVTTDNSQPEQVQTVFDGSHILSLTIDQIRDEYGIPNDTSFVDPTQEQIDFGTSSWSNEYTLGDYTIQIDWDVTSRDVTGFFIATNDPSGTTKDWEHLVTIAGLSTSSNDYTIKPVEANKFPGYYTGVNVTK